MLEAEGHAGHARNQAGERRIRVNRDDHDNRADETGAEADAIHAGRRNERQARAGGESSTRTPVNDGALSVICVFLM